MTPSPSVVPSGAWLRITPDALARNPRPLAARARQLVSDVRRVALITRVEMKTTHFGKTLGWLWYVLEPILLSGMYWFITAVLFDLRAEENDRFLSILAQLGFWLWFSRTLLAAPTTFTAHASLLRDTDFPAGLAFAITMAKEVVIFGIGFAVTIGFLVAFRVHLGLALLALPVVMAAQVAIMLTLSMLLAVAGAFVKDLPTLLGHVLPILWYASPAIYPAALASVKLGHHAWLLQLNPLTWLLPAYESILMRDTVPPLGPLALLTLALIPPMLLGLWVFRRARRRYYSFL
jgi:ABC-2 type transport system permease protein